MHKNGLDHLATPRCCEDAEKEAPLAMLLILSLVPLSRARLLSPYPFSPRPHRTLTELAVAITGVPSRRRQIAATRSVAWKSSTASPSHACGDAVSASPLTFYRNTTTATPTGIHRRFRPLRPSPCLSDHTSGFRVSLRSPSTCPRSLPCCVSSPRSSSPVAVHRHRPPLPFVVVSGNR